jgi:ribosomal protein L11 methyltransferase
MNTHQWVQLTLFIPISRQDLLVGQLAALGFQGFLQEDNALLGFIEKKQWNDERRSQLKYCLHSFSSEFPSLRLRFSTAFLRRQNWNETWERSIRIIEPVPGVIIKPSWRRLRKRDKGKVVLRIDPKMSFGTGYHETTRLCLRMLREYVQPGMSVLDFGSGTGILAIASIKFGARRAVAVDNDDWTIPNIRENVKHNRVTPHVRIIRGGVETVPRSRFDLVVANIDMRTIKTVHAQLVRRLSPGGLLILSGLLTTDLLPLHRLLSHKGISPLNVIEENEWSALALVKT